MLSLLRTPARLVRFTPIAFARAPVVMRQLSYNVLGEELSSSHVNAVRTGSLSSSTEFDGDAAEYVHKEVSAFDRRSIRSAAEKQLAQERDYNSSKPATQCWGRDVDAPAGVVREGLPPPMYEAYEKQTEEPGTEEGRASKTAH